MPSPGIKVMGISLSLTGSLTILMSVRLALARACNVTGPLARTFPCSQNKVKDRDYYRGRRAYWIGVKINTFELFGLIMWLILREKAERLKHSLEGGGNLGPPLSKKLGENSYVLKWSLGKKLGSGLGGEWSCSSHCCVWSFQICAQQRLLLLCGFVNKKRNKWWGGERRTFWLHFGGMDGLLGTVVI